jgi:hypothetical protein
MAATGGVVAGEVEAPELREDAFDHLGDGLRVGHVRREGECLTIPEFIGEPI